ncbi:hypothetical protein D3C81_1796170 [compost metagenome]
MLEQRGNEERMRYQFYRADLALFIPARYAHIAAFQLFRERRRNAVVAVIPFFDLFPAIGFGDNRVSTKFDGIGFLHQRAGQRRNHHSAVSIGFRMRRIAPAQHVSRIFYKRMLEPAAGS